MYNIGDTHRVWCSDAKISGVSAVVKDLLSNRAGTENHQNFLLLVMGS